MKSFKEYIKENDAELLRSVLQLGKEYAFLYKDKWIIDTFHKLDRDISRGSSKNGGEDLFQKTIEWIIKNGKQNNQYLFVSKSSKLGMVVDYRQDKKKKVQGNHLIIVTWLGDVKKKLKKTPDEVIAKQGTEKVIVEELNKSFEIIYLQ